MIKKLFYLLIFIAVAVTSYVLVTSKSGRLSFDNAYVSGRVLHISASSEGLLSDLRVTRGQRVLKGQRLVRIGDIEHQASVQIAAEQLLKIFEDEARSCLDQSAELLSVKRAKLKVDHLEGEIDRYNKLVQAKFLSDTVLETKRFELVASGLDENIARQSLARSAYRNRLPIMERAGIQQAIAELKSAYHLAASADVLAPYDGYIYEVQAYPGQFVKKGDNLLIFLPSEETLIEANVLESELSSLAAGMNVTVIPDVQGGTTELHGRISSIVPSVAASFSPLPKNNLDSNWIKTSQRVPILITLSNENSNNNPLPLGSSVRVVIPTTVNKSTDRALPKIAKASQSEPDELWVAEFDTFSKKLISDYVLSVGPKRISGCRLSKSK